MVGCERNANVRVEVEDGGAAGRSDRPVERESALDCGLTKQKSSGDCDPPSGCGENRGGSGAVHTAGYSGRQ